MTTNQIFYFSRFGAYMRKYVAENRSQLLTLGALALFLPMVLINLTIYVFGWGTWKLPISIPADPNWEYELMFFSALLYLLAIVAGARLYGVLSSKQSRIALFGCPASALEKSLTYFLIYVVAFFTVAYAGAFLADAVRVGIGRAFFADSLPGTPHFVPFRAVFFPGVVREWPVIESVFSSPLVNIFGLQALFIFGTTVWPRHSLVKTIVFILVFNIVFFTLAGWGFSVFFDGHVTPRFSDSPKPAASTVAYMAFGFEAIVTIGLYLLSFFRFKEWEVIQRW